MLTDLIKDWGGFEKLIAKLHESGEVTVEHNVSLQGKSGAPRQIDVLIRHKQGLYEHLVVAECKYWNSHIKRLHVDALAKTIEQVSAARGVIFSTKGFQSGAITQARHEGIELFKIRDLTDEEWGLPGKVVDLCLQIIQPSIGNIGLTKVLAYGFEATGEPLSLSFGFGPEGPLTSTKLLNPDASNEETIEQRLLKAASDALEIFTKEAFTINGGEECTRYMCGRVNWEPKNPPLIKFENAMLCLPKIEFDLGVKISQSRITIDRAKDYMFVLAVESCVTGTKMSAARKLDEKHTALSHIIEKEPRPNDEILKNGSIIRVYMKGLFPFEEMDGLEPISFSPTQHSP